MTVEENERPSPWQEFTTEFPQVWKAIPYKGLFVSLLVVWVYLFEFLGNSTFGYIDTHSLYAWMFYAYISSVDDEHGMYIPLIVLGLFWWKRKDFAAAFARPWLPAMVIIVLALFIHLLGYFAQQARISIAAFYFGIYGLVGLAWGPKVLVKSFFPMCLLVFAVPLGTLAESITFPLRHIATTLTAVFARGVLGINVVQNGTQLYEPTGIFQYEVAAACGGLRSLTAVLALCTIFGFMNFKRWPRRVIMIASAVPLAVAGNVMRLLMIVAVGEAFGQDYGQWVHDSPVFSLLPYVPPIIGILVIGHFLREDRKQTPDHKQAPENIEQPA